MTRDLLTAIEQQSARVVVIGLGYVGLPVACLFADAGFPVVGLDCDRAKVEMIGRGRCPLEGKEPGLADLLARVTAGGNLRVTTEYSACEAAQVVLIAVETPVDPATKKPAYTALRGALADLGPHLSRDTLVIIESTIAPGTMERLAAPTLEEGSGLRVNQDFDLVHCPERVMPGKLLTNLRGCDRVVGGGRPEAAHRAVGLYQHIVHADLDPVDWLTAELVKTMENAYRDVQIAFANEMALLCETMEADVWQVRELVNKSPSRHMHLPGAGVGGHCIPKDPWLLISNAGEGFESRLIPLARAINDGMPLHVAQLTLSALEQDGVEIEEARVLVLGYTYLENADDTRNSPSQVLVEHLDGLGVEVVVHDPYLPAYQGDVQEAAQGCHAVILMVAHDVYRDIDLAALGDTVVERNMIDGRHLFSPDDVRSAGWHYRGVGYGR